MTALAPPSHLAPNVRAVWVEVAPHLTTARPSDRPGVEALCVAIALAREADDTLARDGTYLTHPNGHTYTHPALKVSQRAHLDVRRWSQAFGITPGDRGDEPPRPQTWNDALASRIGTSPRTATTKP